MINANAKMYTLTRTLPDGQQRQQGPFKRPIDAAKAAYRSLIDNRAAGHASANKLAGDLIKAGVGRPVRHVSGYTFRIEVKS